MEFLQRQLFYLKGETFKTPHHSSGPANDEATEQKGNNSDNVGPYTHKDEI